MASVCGGAGSIVRCCRLIVRRGGRRGAVVCAVAGEQCWETALRAVADEQYEETAVFTVTGERCGKTTVGAVAGEPCGKIALCAVVGEQCGETAVCTVTCNQWVKTIVYDVAGKQCEETFPQFHVLKLCPSSILHITLPNADTLPYRVWKLCLAKCKNVH